MSKRDYFKSATLYKNTMIQSKALRFYTHSHCMSDREGLIIYEGDTYHIHLHQTFYKECLEYNKSAMDEFCGLLDISNKPRMNLKHFFRFLLSSFILSIPVLLLLNVFLVNKGFADQKSTLSLFIFMCIIYTIGHLIRIFLVRKYKPNQYKYLFENIQNKEFRKSFEQYRRNHHWGSVFRNYRYTKVWINNSISFMFSIGIAFLVFMGFTLILNESMLSNLDFGTTIMFYQEITPDVRTIKYEVTSSESTAHKDRIRRCGDYYCIMDGTEIYDNDFNIVFSNELIDEIGKYEYIDIEDKYVLLGSVYSERDYIIYDLETQSIIHKDRNTFGSFNYVESRITSFTHIDDVFYISLVVIPDSSVTYTENTYLIVVDDDVVSRFYVGVFNPTSLQYINGALYYYGSSVNESGYLLGKSGIRGANFEMKKSPINVPVQLIASEDALYFASYRFFGGLYEVESDLDTTMIYRGMPTYNTKENKDSIFMVGQHISDFELIDKDGTVLIDGLYCTDCNEDTYIFTIDGDTVKAYNSVDTIYTFEKTDENKQYVHMLYMNDVDAAELDEYRGNPAFMGIIILFVSIPYIRISGTLISKTKNDKFFLKFVMHGR